MWDRLSSWHKAALVAVAIMGAGWGAHAEINHWTTQIAANSERIAIITYDRLLRKLHAEGRLGPRDLRAFCEAASRLRIGHPLCR